MLHDDNDATIPVAREEPRVTTRPARSKRWTIPPPVPPEALKPRPIQPTVTLETSTFTSWVVDTEIMDRTRFPRGTSTGSFDRTESVPIRRQPSRLTMFLLVEGLAVLAMIVVVIVLALR